MQASLVASATRVIGSEPPRISAAATADQVTTATAMNPHRHTVFARPRNIAFSSLRLVAAPTSSQPRAPDRYRRTTAERPGYFRRRC